MDLKPLKITGILLFSGIFLLLSGIILDKSVYENVLMLNGSYGKEKVVVKYKNQIFDKSQERFTIKDMDMIKDAMEGLDMTYTVSVWDSVSGNGENVYSEIIGTNSLFPHFSRVHMLKGSFLTEKACDRGEAVAVIDERLAAKLFNTADVLGSQIEIAGKSFILIGVFSSDESILQKLTDKGIPFLYIPAAALLELYSEASITHFEVQSPYSNTLGKNAETISKVIQATGKNTDDYTITDFNIAFALLAQKINFVLFLMGLVVIWILFVYLKRQFTVFISAIKERLGGDYLKSILGKSLPAVAVLLIKTAAVALSVALFWHLVKFDLYIPPEYIPSDLTDIGYFADLANKNIQKVNLNPGYIAAWSEKTVNTAGTLIDLILCVFLLPGAVLFYTGIYKIWVLKQSITKFMMWSGLFMVAAPIITAIICMGMDIGPCFDLKILWIVWIFIFTNLYRPYIYERKVKFNV